MIKMYVRKLLVAALCFLQYNDWQLSLASDMMVTWIFLYSPNDFVCCMDNIYTELCDVFFCLTYFCIIILFKKLIRVVCWGLQYHSATPVSITTNLQISHIRITCNLHEMHRCCIAPASHILILTTASRFFKMDFLWM